MPRASACGSSWLSVESRMQRGGEQQDLLAGGEAATRAAQRAYAQEAAHPAEALQKNWLQGQLETQHFIMGSIYGTAMPMQRRMEMGILSQVGRLPGLPSSHLGLNTVLGRDETIDWEDYLGLPENSEVAVDMRAQLERKYGITPQSSALGPAALGGVPDKLRQAAAPREGVALRKDLC
ncbi:hypothetical protein EMIHUDRAFT_463181 [Emiliania huxleyi CCMP1516]|uniref:Uncharacterized protein n=2 Tax=Emiliania huxleyi TaxID=2903 RepID=A0A0D3JW42_EMIH1|nr:hypothetical protein EMIHUDRAFT_463181 [Emiliania huxleyi CCMP1516]EOD27727.1 hypothetical protein EMIHUDRAFT_463181 [Emiliania huxleyi CCMP1516]|eukprot:XP_005780156.1 hypothetical protein EMIHUDRAFT_463181 [Emiliania huxleyi CCMP1516]